MKRPSKLSPSLSTLIILFWIGLLGFALFRSPSSPARLPRVESDLRAIESSLKTYRTNAGNYPTTAQGLEALVTKPATAPIPKRWVRICETTPTDPWQTPYRYSALPEGNKRGFEIISAGKDGQFGTEDDFSSLELTQ